jgi:hypothetical protein
VEERRLRTEFLELCIRFVCRGGEMVGVGGQLEEAGDWKEISWAEGKIGIMSLEQLCPH